MAKHTHILARTVVAIGALVTASLSTAAADYTVEKLHYQIRVDSTLRSEQQTEAVIQVNTDKGVQLIGQYLVTYVDGMQELTLLEAETIAADGKRISVDPMSGIIDQPLPFVMRTPVIGQMKARTIVFPALVAGAKIHLKYVIKEKALPFPGFFNYQAMFPPTLSKPLDNLQIDLTLPADVKVNISQTGLQATSEKSAPGERSYRWTYTSPAENTGTAKNPASQQSPQLVVTTFKGWPELAAQYKARITGKSNVDTTIQQKADELVAGITDEKEQARRLYNFVVQQIRPVALTSGYPLNVPYDAAAVLRNRYGDDNDRATLFAALLKAKNIRSTTALINASGSAYELPSVVALSGSFSRVITYLPEWNLFVDTNSSNAAFGELPFVLADKPALLVDNGQIKRTPVQNSDVASNTFNGVIKLDEKGSAAIKAVNKTTGHEAIEYRTNAATREPVEANKAQLARLKLNGQIAYDNDDVKTLDDGYTTRWQGTFDRLIDLDKKSFTVPQLPAETDLGAYAIGLRKQKDVKTNWSCDGNRKQARIQFEFPQGVKVATLPQNVNVRAGDISYTATYAIQNETLVVDRIVTRMQPSNLCTPEQANEWQAIADAIDKDVKTPILLQ